MEFFSLSLGQWFSVVGALTSIVFFNLFLKRTNIDYQKSITLGLFPFAFLLSTNLPLVFTSLLTPQIDTLESIAWVGLFYSITTIFIVELIIYPMINVDTKKAIIMFYISSLIVAIVWKIYGSTLISGVFPLFVGNIAFLYFFYRIGLYHVIQTPIKYVLEGF